MRTTTSVIIAAIALLLASGVASGRGRTAPPPYGAGLGNIGSWLEPGPIWGWENDPWGWGDGGDGGWGDGIDGGWGPVNGGGKGSGGAGWGGWGNGGKGGGDGLGGHDWGFGDDGGTGGGTGGGNPGGGSPVGDAGGLIGTCYVRIIGPGNGAGDKPICACIWLLDECNLPAWGTVVSGTCQPSRFPPVGSCKDRGDECTTTFP